MSKESEQDNQVLDPGGEVEEADSWRLRQGSESNQSVNLIRSKIHVLLDFFVIEGMATRNTVDDFQKATEADQTLEGVTGFYHWIVEKRFMAIRMLAEIQAEIGNALTEEICSEEDGKGLMAQLVLTDQVDFVGHADRIQEAIRQILGEMEADRKEFDAIVAHPLVKEGVLVIDDGNEIEIPDLEGFLEMSVEERREFLLEVRNSFPEAGRYKEREERLEALRLEKEFHGLLVDNRKEGIVGTQVIRRFMGLFRKLGNGGRQEAVEALDKILEPYVELWGEIREILDGNPLARLEGLLDLLDHKQLREQFEKTVGQERMRLDWEYSQTLDKAYAKKILPSKVRKEWKGAMESEDLEGKRERLESVDAELEPYAELREEINGIEDPDRIRQLDAMFQGGLFGLEEIRHRLEELSDVEEDERADEGPDENSIKILSKVRRDRVRDSIVETSEALDVTQKRNLVRRLTHYLDGRLSHDYKDYDENVKDAWAEQKKATIRQNGLLSDDEEEKLLRQDELLKDESDEIVLPIESQGGAEAEQVKVIEIPEPEEETNEEETFQETVYMDEEDEEEDTRVVKMEISNGEAVNRFNANALLNEKNDKLSLMTGGLEFDVEFNLMESRALVEKLKIDVKNEERGMKIAA